MSAYGDTRIVWSPTCWRCGRRLAEYLSLPYSIRCQRCRAPNREGPIPSPPSHTLDQK